MRDQALIYELASCPPDVRAHRLHQASVIDPLLSDGVTSEHIEIACSDLGVTRRRVRQLMGLALQRKQDTHPRGHSTGFGLWLGDLQESLINEALSFAGDDAKLKAVCDLVSDLSCKRQVTPPSTATIRHRYNVTRSRKRSFAHLHLDSETTLDVAPLYLSVLGARSAPQTAWLLVRFDSKTTQVLDYEIFSGRPTATGLSREIRSIYGDGGNSGGIGATNTILKVLNGAVGYPDRQIRPACSIRSLTAGAVARSAFGLRIGKIKLRADTRALRKADMAPVTLEVARDVIGYLLDKYNIEHQSVSGINISSDSLAA